ncbi:MAG: GGDEF domain-containing protein [Pseudomonas sp.]|uniref:GGDEF domain-containing protein n=1 Tax=Pseudomonas sp. TaxID=306 RepID=UPI003BB5D9C9
MFEKLFDGNFMPHGHCFLWRPDLLFLHVTGDLLTSISYGIIPLGLVYIVLKRHDLSFDWLFMLFAAFIFFCGLTHVLGMINIWHGYYYVEGVVKLFTGLISAITAVMLIKLIPSIVKIPSAQDLEQSNRELILLKNQLQENNLSLELRVAQRTEELERLAITDALTGIYNRGEIMRRGYAEFERGERYQHRLAALMIDIDFFKQINDQFGRQVGDLTLKLVATEIQSCCRLSDSLGRYGGEEFLLLCPEMDKSSAWHMAERVREKVAALRPEFGQQVTVSIGVADSSDQTDLETLINAADQALYLAKEQGRNKVLSYTGSAK